MYQLIIKLEQLAVCSEMHTHMLLSKINLETFCSSLRKYIHNIKRAADKIQ